MSFILSLIHYDNDGDGSKADRVRQLLPSVPALEVILLLNFLKQLVFDREESPRFSLNRLNLYRHMHDWFDKHQLSTPSEGSVLDEDHNLVLDEAFYEKLKKLGGSENSKFWYTPAVDTHYRCIRILFFPSNDSSPGHMQISVARPTTQAWAQINRIVTDNGGNIIRSQIRPGLSKDKTDKFGRLSSLNALEQRRAGRYELTIEPVARGKSTAALIRKIEDAIRRDEYLESCGADITDEVELGDD